MARLVLSKGLEVNENHAPSLNLMGVVHYHLGEDQDAYDYFKKALDSDSGNLPARLNMAAIFMQYQDEARARAVLKPAMSRVRSLDLSTPDIHPSVKDALSKLRIR
jgi:Tfp pilus assembly protein PilF